MTSVLDSPIFRELTGAELLEVLAEEFSAEFRRQMKLSGEFDEHKSYPVVAGELRLKVFPERELPEEAVIKFRLGDSPLTAPDRVRERYGLTILQPQRVGRRIKNMPVERQ